MSDLLGRLAELTGPERARLMARLRQRAATSAEQSADPTAASDAQQRLWLLQRLDPGSPAHHLSAALHLAGPLDAEGAAPGPDRDHGTARVAAHGFPRGGRAAGTARRRVPFRRTAPGRPRRPALGEAERRARALHAEQGRRPFELDRAPLARFTLYRLTAERHVLTVVAHHLVCDGWSMGVFTTELVALYEAFTEGRPSPLPPSAAVPAGERRPSGEERDRSVRYWREELSGDLPVLERCPPTARGPRRPRTGAPGTASGFPAGLHQELRAAAGRDRATVYGVLLAAYAVTLHRITGQLDLVVGAPVDERQGAGEEGLIGFFVNTLPLRLRAAAGPDVRGDGAARRRGAARRADARPPVRGHRAGDQPAPAARPHGAAADRLLAPARRPRGPARGRADRHTGRPRTTSTSACPRSTSACTCASRTASCSAASSTAPTCSTPVPSPRWAEEFRGAPPGRPLAGGDRRDRRPGPESNLTDSQLALWFGKQTSGDVRLYYENVTALPTASPARSTTTASGVPSSGWWTTATRCAAPSTRSTASRCAGWPTASRRRWTWWTSPVSRTPARPPCAGPGGAAGPGSIRPAGSSTPPCSS